MLVTSWQVYTTRLEPRSDIEGRSFHVTMLTLPDFVVMGSWRRVRIRVRAISGVGKLDSEKEH